MASTNQHISTSAHRHISTLILLIFISISAFGQSNLFPNVFTPNNDSFNDVFKTINNNITTLNCTLYNRWGTLVCELTKPNEVWDGRTTSGIECSTGVYYYVLTATGENGENLKEKGFVTLIK